MYRFEVYSEQACTHYGAFELVRVGPS